jgi:hypothetical protein
VGRVRYPYGRTARDVDDAAEALSDHVRDHQFHPEHHPAHIDRHDAVKVIHIDVNNAHHGRRRSRIIHQAIDPLEVGHCAFDHGIDLASIGDVRPDEPSGAAKLAFQ